MPLACGLIAQWPHVPIILRRLGTSEAAAWVQAIGSVAAICGAIWIAQTSERRRMEDNRKKECATLQMLAILSRRVLLAADTLLDVVEGREEALVSDLDLKTSLRGIERFPIEQIPVGPNVLRTMTVIGLTQHFLGQHDKWYEAVTKEPRRPLTERIADATTSSSAKMLRQDRDHLETRVRQIARDWRLATTGDAGLADWLDDFISPKE
jgi:hypothetical protein